jgi:hypothetical protein
MKSRCRAELIKPRAVLPSMHHDSLAIKSIIRHARLNDPIPQLQALNAKHPATGERAKSSQPRAAEHFEST